MVELNMSMCSSLTYPPVMKHGNSCSCWKPESSVSQTCLKGRFEVETPMWTPWYPVDVPSNPWYSMIFHDISMFCPIRSRSFCTSMFWSGSLNLYNLCRHAAENVTGCPCARGGKVIAPMWGTCNAAMWCGRPRGTPLKWHGSPKWVLFFSEVN